MPEKPTCPKCGSNLTVPLGQAWHCRFSAAGLPLGLQIMGRHWDEATVYRVGAAYEQATDWHNRRPNLA